MPEIIDFTLLAQAAIDEKKIFEYYAKFILIDASIKVPAYKAMDLLLNPPPKPKKPKKDEITPTPGQPGTGTPK